MRHNDALADKVREYLRLEHKLYRTTCAMTNEEFDSACYLHDQLREEIHAMVGVEVTE